VPEPLPPLHCSGFCRGVIPLNLASGMQTLCTRRWGRRGEGTAFAVDGHVLRALTLVLSGRA